MKSILALLGLFVSLAPLVAQDIPLSQILIDKEGWKVVLDKRPGVTFLDANAKGVGIYQSKLAAWLDDKGQLAKDTPPSDGPRDATSARTSKIKEVYAIHRDEKTVRVESSGRSPKLPGLVAPTCVTLWPDEGHLVIGEADGGWLWAVRLEADGSFGPGDRYYSLRTRPDIKMHVSAMIMDAEFLLYACTPIGIQVFDPTGRLSGVISAPAKEPMTAITLGGVNGDQLFVAAGDTIYARKIQKKAAYTKIQK